MKFKPKKLLIIAVALIVSIGGLGILLNHGSFETFAINDFVDASNLQSGDRIVVDVKCYLSAVTYYEDGEGHVLVQSDGSQFLKENPRFDLTKAFVQGTGQQIKFIHPTLSAKCQMPSLVSGGKTIYPLAVEKGSAVKYRIVSQSSATEPQPKIVTWIKDTTLPKDVYLFHDTQTVIYEDLVPVDEIVKRLEDGEYDSFQQVDWTGYLNMHLHNPSDPYAFANAKWYIDFTKGSNSNKVEPINELTTWLEIFVQKSTTVQTAGSGGQQPQQTPKDASCTGDCTPATKPNVVEEWFGCAVSGETNCFMNTKYYPYYVGIGILLGLVIYLKPDGDE